MAGDTQGGRGAIAALALPLAAAAVLFVAVAWREPPRRSERLDVYRIPPGTGQRVTEGLPIDAVLPRKLDTTVGAGLEVINEDVVSHVFGPFVLAPGQRWSQRYGMAGDYSVACSLYPDVDLVISVAPSSSALGVATAVHRAWLVLWAATAAAVVAGTARLLSAPRAAADAAGWEAKQPPAVPRALDRLSTAGWALVAMTGALVAFEMLALSRVAPWRPVLTSRALPLWMAAVSLALAVPILVGAAARPALRRPLLLTVPIAVAVVIGAGTAPTVGFDAFGWSFVVLGVGMVSVAVWSTAASSGAEAETSAIARLAFAGLVLVVVGLPWPGETPVLLALRGAVTLALGIAVLLTALRAGPGTSPGARALLMLLGGSIAVLASAQLFISVLRHIEAVTVPLAGNPVESDAASVSRGERLWERHCAACHPPETPLLLGTDYALLDLITNGHSGVPGLAYDLSLQDRGNIVNYMREASVGSVR